MSPAVNIFIALFVLSAASVAATWMLSHLLTPERRHPQLLRWLIAWSVKGLLVPLAIWALMNLGLSWNLQPFMPQVQAAQNSGSDWFPEYLRVLATGLFVISTYWTTVTLSWCLIEAGSGMEGDAQAQFKSLCLLCFIAMVVPALVLWFFAGWPLFGLAGIAVLGPMAGYGSRILQLKKTPPIYARAIARMKFGKYSEAELEIIQELEKCEDDFDGWLMLAGLYANQFNDLAEAEKTILEICGHPNTTAPQLSIALHQLANWHLQRRGDPAAARRALQMICSRLPGSHLAHMAQLRINQLPASAAEFRQQQSGATIPLPALGDSIDQAPPTESRLERHKAAEAANACVEILERDPNNAPARERLARLFAEHLDQPDRGIEQASLLLDLPDQPEARRAEWLSLIAAWHIRYRHDTNAARETLERLVREFPQTPQALAARRRLQLMDAEASSRAARQ
jgi:tetratricopeptide (TPR) repeat protein